MKWQIDYFHWWLLRVIKRKFNYFNSLEFKAAKKKISLLQVIRPFLETSVYLSPRKQPFQTSPGAGHHDGVTAPRPWDTRVCPQGQKTPGRVNRLRAERWRLRNSHRRWNPPSGCRNPISGWGRLTTSNSFYSFSYRCSQGKTHLDSHASDWGDPKADDRVPLDLWMEQKRKAGEVYTRKGVKVRVGKHVHKGKTSEHAEWWNVRPAGKWPCFNTKWGFRN